MVFLAVGLTGCAGTFETRPYTRVEYQENAWVPDEGSAIRSQTLYLTAGPSISYSTSEIYEGEPFDRSWWTANLGVSAAMTAYGGHWGDYEPATALSPDVMIFLDDDASQFIHFSADAAFYVDGANYFGFLAWEKIW